MSKYKIKSDKVYKYGLILVFTSLLVFAVFLYLKSKNNIEGQSEVNTDLKVSEDAESQAKVSWDIYTNDEYGFEISYPRLLKEVEIENQGGYELFIRFEETEFSQGKGVGVGVSKASLEEEVEKITSNIKEEFDVEPDSTSKVDIYGYPAFAMQYSFIGEYEPRSFIVINNGNYTFSISSTPEQMDTLVESLVFK